MNTPFLPSRLQKIVILFSIASLPVISQLQWMQAHNRFSSAGVRGGGAAVAGLLFGFLFLFLVKKLLQKKQSMDGEQVWEGLTFFSVTLLGAWFYVLPVPPKYGEFIAAFLFTAGTAKVLSVAYQEFGTSLSNRTRLATNFVVLATTTMVVISVVKSSLALSLGLVGALSIVRFRTAIKDPEELSFLFFTIVLGLGFGAGQILYTFIGFVGILAAFILTSHRRRRARDRYNFIVSISVPGEEPGTPQALLDGIRSVASRFEIKRMDVAEELSELILMVEVDGTDLPGRLMDAVKRPFPEATVSITSSQGLG